MRVEEVRQRILEKDPVFGKKCLDYFDSLNLDNISVPFSIPNEATIAIRGTKRVRDKSDSHSLTDIIYEVGFITSNSCCLGIEFGRYNERRSPYCVFLTEKDGIIINSMPTHLGLMNYISQSRLKEDLTFLEELVRTVDGLGIK